jgi:hypothetical protein
LPENTILLGTKKGKNGSNKGKRKRAAEKL